VSALGRLADEPDAVGGRAIGIDVTGFARFADLTVHEAKTGTAATLHIQSTDGGIPAAAGDSGTDAAAALPAIPAVGRIWQGGTAITLRVTVREMRREQAVGDGKRLPLVTDRDLAGVDALGALALALPFALPVTFPFAFLGRGQQLLETKQAAKD
jgi:hypothetical protein